MILIQDETAIGEILNRIELEVSQEIMTVAELISQRVNYEVARFNEQTATIFKGLVQPADSEKNLNGYQLKQKRMLDAEEQVYKALDAFQKNGFFVLVQDRQVESLSEQIWVDKDIKVSFVKLTPLVGG